MIEESIEGEAKAILDNKNRRKYKRQQSDYRLPAILTRR